MNPEQKARTARILGYICMAVGALNLTLVAVHAAGDQTQAGFPLLGTGIAALTIGFIMLALGKRKSTPGG